MTPTKEKIFFEYLDKSGARYKTELNTTCKTIANILNFIASYFPWLTPGVAEISHNGEDGKKTIYYVRRALLAGRFDCDPMAPCSNFNQLGTIALSHFKNHTALQNTVTIQKEDFGQQMLKEMDQRWKEKIADKQKSDLEMRKKMKAYQKKDLERTALLIEQLKNQRDALPSDDKGRKKLDDMIHHLLKSHESVHHNLEEIATACGIG
jgi:hypothetical protein